MNVLGQISLAASLGNSYVPPFFFISIFLPRQQSNEASSSNAEDIATEIKKKKLW